MDSNYLKNIRKGMKVTILTSKKKYSTGIVDEIATRTPFNEQGIMVRLNNKDIGRVKKIILSEPEQNELVAEEIKKLIKNGESFKTEFKKEVFWRVHKLSARFSAKERVNAIGNKTVSENGIVFVDGVMRDANFPR